MPVTSLFADKFSGCKLSMLGCLPGECFWNPPKIPQAVLLLLMNGNNNLFQQHFWFQLINNTKYREGKAPPNLLCVQPSLRNRFLVIFGDELIINHPYFSGIYKECVLPQNICLPKVRSSIHEVKDLGWIQQLFESSQKFYALVVSTF